MTFLQHLVLILTLLLVITNSFAQSVTAREIERDLVQARSKVWPYDYDNRDSVELYSSLFSKKIITYIAKYPSTLDYPFQSLIDSNYCEIVTSTDGLFRVYSWDTWLGGTMHFFKNIYQYKSGDKVYSKTLDLEEGDPSCFYSDISMLKANSKTYYLTVNNGMYSTKDVSQSIKFFTIENDSLNDTIKLIKTQGGLTNEIEVSFNFFSVVDRPERP